MKNLTPEEAKFRGFEILLDAEENECSLEDVGKLPLVFSVHNGVRVCLH